jgi:hypothetical protein
MVFVVPGGYVPKPLHTLFRKHVMPARPRNKIGEHRKKGKKSVNLGKRKADHITDSVPVKKYVLNDRANHDTLNILPSIFYN